MNVRLNMKTIIWGLIALVTLFLLVKHHWVDLIILWGMFFVGRSLRTTRKTVE